MTPAARNPWHDVVHSLRRERAAARVVVI